MHKSDIHTYLNQLVIYLRNCLYNAFKKGSSIKIEESEQIVELNDYTPTNLNSEIHSMLCYPIISEEKDILHGVVEVINKVISEDSSESNVFTSSDKEVCF